MENEIRELDGANMDIDLTTRAEDIQWKQDICPWNADDNKIEHKCAVKNTSICKYFCGIKALDTILCSYPHENKDWE